MLFILISVAERQMVEALVKKNSRACQIPCNSADSENIVDFFAIMPTMGNVTLRTGQRTANRGLDELLRKAVSAKDLKTVVMPIKKISKPV